MSFVDRADAGRRLAERLRGRVRDAVVLGLPRGGVPVAAEVAAALGAPLDVIVVRKLGVPSHPELAMGAVGEDGVLVLHTPVIRQIRITESELAELERRARDEVNRRAERFRRGRTRVPLDGRTALVVDDGIATGSTARAACEVAREHGAARVVLAVPVCAPESAGMLRRHVDELVCLEIPDDFRAVGLYYEDFHQISDDEVVAVLERNDAAPGPGGGTDGGTGGGTDGAAAAVDGDVDVPVGRLRLPGHLTVPERAAGLVVFAHGSGSSRHSARNRYVASVLQRAGLGTLLFDLLTEPEERDRANVFDVALLAGRLAAAGRWVRDVPACRGLPLGYFGASTGAAAALWAATEPGVAAVVSRGGRPDLAGPRLGDVLAPTLLVVGGDDTAVLELNRRAQAQLRCPNRLAVVDGATHLFAEPGTLERAAGLARDWFVEHLVGAPDPVG